MKDHGCESYNVLVDLPEVNKTIVNPDRTSHSKRDWNKLQAVLNRSTFDSTVKMLELNTDNKITFVVEKLKADVIKPLFEDKNSTVLFQAALNELDLIKIKIPFKEELKCIFEGNMDMYNNRIDERLSCKVCNFYESPDDGGLPISRPFKCTHFYHPQCVTAWKFFGLVRQIKKRNLCQMNVLFVKVDCVIYTKIYMITIGIPMELLQDLKSMLELCLLISLILLLRFRLEHQLRSKHQLLLLDST